MNVEFDLQTHLAGMEARIVEEVRTNKKDLQDGLDKLDARVDKLESWRNYLAGAWAVVLMGVGYKFKS